MSNKFGSLVADVSTPFKVELIDPTTEDIIRDKAGRASYIAVWAADSEQARQYGKQKRKDLNLRIKQSRNGKVEPDDALDANMATCAVLTAEWYLVDRLTREPIDVPCTPENAAELYSAPGMGWLFVQPWAEANNAANFLQKPPTSSLDMPKPSSELLPK
ncbi:hypothetical protein [Rhodopseudomonas sp. RCAM05734]|uniref:hypothetical protein n=1 Tax=Rhodopseudomonas sp. RCAM05734 TaxID=3457549 RepID=UPI004044BA16